MNTPKLAQLVSIRALALSQGVPLETMRKRILRLEAEGPCAWIVRSAAHRRGVAVRINVEMMRAARPELFDPVCLSEQVSEHEDKIDALAEVLRGHEMRLRALEGRRAEGQAGAGHARKEPRTSPNFPTKRTG